MSKTTSNTLIESPQAFLEAVYHNLDYISGELWDANGFYKSNLALNAETWLEKGDWLSLAKKVGAEKIFFINNDPVIIFCSSQASDPTTLLNIFRRVWCMARPHFLFVAVPGELKVYGLNDYPSRTVTDWEKVEPLDIVEKIADVSDKLYAYHRTQIESGQVFKDKKVGQLEQRADKRLISDLKTVRKNLLELNKQVKQRHIHALIGRSIFIRYLEDRGILISDYFRQVAQNKTHPEWRPDWLDILEKPESKAIITEKGDRYYTRVLRDHAFTYALFDQLTEHFNGDMFPRDPEERSVITQEHLNLLRRFLLGDADSYQRKLFFWAYDFEIIPIELISSIYEEFYHKSSIKDKGTHYTPSVLVEYILSQLLTPERLSTMPKILDFACGSAIFLVHAYRRIVRYQETQRGRSLNASELRQILKEQITGIEINEEAIHVAAFSLYLALLHYQEPKDILAQIEQANGEKPLPHLIHNPEHAIDTTHYHTLYHANAFGLLNSEREYLAEYLENNKRFSGRTQYVRIVDSQDSLPFQPHSFDIVVGNPPWGYIKKNEGTPELHAAQDHAQRWCEVFDWSIGDNELSQAFIARAATLLKSDGECGLLVSIGVLLKRHENSLKFRQRWLEENTINKVVNFSHVRTAFFSGAISPFCFIQYQPKEASSSHYVQYWSAKKTEFIEGVQAVILNLPDLHRVRQLDLENNDWLWKTYWWGSHRDANLISTLSIEENLFRIALGKQWDYGRGFEKDFPSGDHKQSDWLKDYQLLPTGNFQRYGEVVGLKSAPEVVHRFGNPEIYDGWRLLVKRGITQADGADGRIEARLEDQKYCVLNSIHGINLENASDRERKVLTGILWSSVARYFFFMTTSSWGTWHHEIHLQDGLLSLPICFPDNLDLRQRIVSIVDELRAFDPTPLSIFNSQGMPTTEIKRKQNMLEKQLDQAIFELYGLNESERDLILDMCETGLEFFYRGGKSKAIEPVEPYPSMQGTFTDLPCKRGEERGLEGYLYAFLQRWNQELDSLGGEFRWQIIRPSRIPMLAVVFTTQEQNQQLPVIEVTDEAGWDKLLERLSKTRRQPVNSHIYIDGMVRTVTDTNIFIIKRNERRLWTRSLAREDAEATLLQAMIMQESLNQL